MNKIKKSNKSGEIEWELITKILLGAILIIIVLGLVFAFKTKIISLITGLKSIFR